MKLVAALQRVTAWFLLALVVSIPLAVPGQLRALDFAAFYCAGEALAQHADPYRMLPLGACESRVSRNDVIAAGVVTPAPLPPYALGVFALLSRLPFELAQHAFDLLSIAAFVLSIRLLRRTTGRPVLVVAYALAPIAWIVLLLGQSVILILAALSATAFFLECGRDRCAALCACPMMVDPHLGLPVCLALFLLRPRTRLTLLAGAALVVIFSLTVVPWSLTTEYVSQVLPLHAMSETRAAGQISFTSLLTFFGVSDHLAIVLGGAQYAAAVTLGILIARRVGSPSAVAFVPAVAALVGGSFLHGYDLLLGIPAALMLWAKRPMIAALAIIAISPHWDEVTSAIAPFVTMAAAVILLSYAGLSFKRSLLGVSVLALILVIDPHPARRAAFAATVPSTAYAERSWSAWEVANPRSPWWLTKNLPDWAGIITICLLAASEIEKGGIHSRLRNLPRRNVTL
jgi:hypothetical protein